MTQRTVPLTVAVVLLLAAILGVVVLSGGFRPGPDAGLPPGEASSSAMSVDPVPEKVAVTLYFVATEDKAAAFTGAIIGCNDTLVASPLNIINSSNVIGDAYAVLLQQGNKIAEAKGLYNALSGSTLVPQAVLLEAGVLAVHLSGSLLSGGTCDDPRIKEQLTQLGMQFPGVRETKVFINGMELSQYQSQR